MYSIVTKLEDRIWTLIEHINNDNTFYLKVLFKAIKDTIETLYTLLPYKKIASNEKLIKIK